jgi:hypothetical protein
MLGVGIASSDKGLSNVRWIECDDSNNNAGVANKENNPNVDNTVTGGENIANENNPESGMKNESSDKSNENAGASKKMDEKMEIETRRIRTETRSQPNRERRKGSGCR